MEFKRKRNEIPKNEVETGFDIILCVCCWFFWGFFFFFGFFFFTVICEIKRGREKKNRKESWRN